MVSKGNTILSKKVCVIGAGPSGLVAARELQREGHDVVVFEQKHDIGGQWLYDPITDDTGNISEVHSSIYASLRLVSPREALGFTDFPFLPKKGRDMRRFPGHREFFLYIRDFVEYFGLRKLIRLNTKVEVVEMLGDFDPKMFGSKDLKWVVKSKEKKNSSNSEKLVEEVFDAVVVASGNESQPRLPKIGGMDSWSRKQLHSHVYRVPEPFHNEVVVVIGNSLSGQDIAMELVSVAKEVHLSAKSLDISQGLQKVISQHDNLYLKPEVDSLEKDGRVMFIDGSWIIADTIIYCTGYSYSFPFLDTKGTVVVDDDKVGPLFEHAFPPSLAPSLSFIGIPRKIIGFPFFECQAKWIAQLLSGKKKLPSVDEMELSIQDFNHSREIAGIPKHKTHNIANFEYCDKYADYVGFPHLEEWRKELCLSALRNAELNLDTYRDSYNEDDELMLQLAYSSPHFIRSTRARY